MKHFWHGFKQRLMAFDVYLVGRHQRAANWIYTLWGMSPYQVGAQCFAISGILGAGVFMLNDGSDGAMGLGLNLLLASLWFWNCVHRDGLWRRHRLTAVANEWIIVGLRYLLAAASAGLLLDLLFSILSGGDASLHKVIATLREIALTSGFYFYSCQPPTRIERRDPRLVPQSAG